MSDYRSKAIAKAASLPVGDPQRKKLLAALRGEYNRHARGYTFKRFKEEYFADEPNVADRIAREFWSDFQYAFVGPMKKYIAETRSDSWMRAAADEVQWDSRLLAVAAKAIETEKDALEAVQVAFAAWKATHKGASERMAALRKDMDAKYDHRVWRDEVTSAFSGATWGGLDVRDFVKAMGDVEKALGGTYGTLENAQRILDDIKRLS